MSENINELLEVSENNDQQESEGSFFSFQKMISSALIKFIYILGLIGITIGGITFIVNGAYQRYGGEKIILSGIAIIILGNLIWRVLCESMIVLFSLHETTVNILNELKQKQK